MILEPVLADVVEAARLEIEIFDDSRGRVRHERLTAVGDGTDPRGAVDADADVPALRSM